MSSLSRDTKLAILRDWARHNGYISEETLRLRLGLSHAEWRAVGHWDEIIPQVKLPDEIFAQVQWYYSGYYRSDFELTEHDRSRIADATYLTKQEACIRLGISPRTFDRWKRMTNTKSVCSLQMGSSPSVLGYRQNDIDSMAQTIRSRRSR